MPQSSLLILFNFRLNQCHVSLEKQDMAPFKRLYLFFKLQNNIFWVNFKIELNANHTPCFKQAQKFLANQFVLYSLRQEFAYFLQLATCCCHYLLTSSETGGCYYWLLLSLGCAAFHCGGEFNCSESCSASEMSSLQLITFTLHYYITSGHFTALS